ncbi:MAG: hypothetical protein OEW77_05915 [Gemmatimonadota bacterium]|nr:hypothetical protein [Gemmatimonadota bacterium]
MPCQSAGCSPCTRRALGTALALVLALVLVASSSVSAQDASAPTVSALPAAALTRKAPYRVVVDQLTGSVVLENQAGKVLERWAQFSTAAPVADIPVDRPVSVVITNANPLLYTYGVKAELVRQESVKSCRDIGSRFLSGGFILSSAAVSGAVSPGLSAPVLPTGSLDLSSAFAQLASRGSTRLTEGVLEAEMERIRASVNAYADLTHLLARLGRTLDDSIGRFAARGESVPLDVVLGRFQASLDAVAEGLSDPARTPAIIEQRSSDASAAVSSLQQMVVAIQSGNYAGSSSDLVAREALALHARVTTGVDSLEASYPALQTSLLRIARARAQTTRIFTLSAGEGAVRRISIAPQETPEYKNVVRLHGDGTDVFTRPRQGLICEVALGVNWLKPLPTYAFASSTLIDSNTKDQRVTPSLLIQVASSSFPILGMHLGVGLGENSAPDLYLGATIRILEPVLLNVGWVWQRTPQLPAGLLLGQVVTNPDPAVLSDLDKKFKPSLYFGLAIAR